MTAPAGWRVTWLYECHDGRVRGVVEMPPAAFRRARRGDLVTLADPSGGAAIRATLLTRREHYVNGKPWDPNETWLPARERDRVARDQECKFTFVGRREAA